MIQISNINKSFKKNRVLKNISFDIEKGTCTALIGKNGAGKSTLVDILSNKIIADDGVILDKDKLLQSENRSIMFQKTMFPDQLKVIGIIKLYQSFYENPLTLDVIIELTKFNSNQLNQFANKLSGGQQRLLDFVISLIGQPQLILLDEPTSNMDIEMREYFWSIIAKLKEENRTILYTSHYIEEVERMSDKIILIENGEIKLNDSTSHIRTNQQSQITLSDEYKRKLKPDKDDLVIQKNHNGTIKIITSNVNDTILYLQQLHINLDDIEMSGMTGLEVLSEIRKKHLNIKVIIVTTFKRPGYFEKAVANDVDAYVLKERSIEELVETIYKVYNGKKEYSASLMTSFFTDKNPLTPKEQIVLREIGNGLSSKEISEKLFLTDGTVRNYTSVRIDKLFADNRFDAWKKANEKGWI
ncbi:TPA: ATP-binding cassette domain-containing protein [Staphylococcus aureus]|nr:ATP-binding cassette domain-containing protein [Staphylococcus aureus]